MFSCVKSFFAAAFVGTVLSLSVGSAASAAPPETAPDALTATIAELESAANAQNLEQVMALYSSSFRGPDGFTRSQYQATLSEFWAQYTTLTYDVELVSWEAEGNGFLAETLTTVQGLTRQGGRSLTMTAEVRSQQRFENGQLVAQEILAEQSRLESGMTPPTVTIRLPESVDPGASFAFDAIVKEPLGDRLLLGRALDEGITAEDFLTPRPLDLEQLSSGGLFRVGKAPDKVDQRWISSILIREDGIVIDTRRLRIGS